MTDNKAIHTIDRAVEVLTGVATNRAVIKQELAGLPDDDPTINKTAVEYELQLLRIVFTGWALAYYLTDHPQKNRMAESFWLSVHAFAGRISTLASAGTDGKTIDYFGAVRERIQSYIDALNTNMEEADPADVVAAVFSRLCGGTGTRVMADAGRKVFIDTLNTVKVYLETISLQE